MKKLHYLLILLFSVVFISCGDDDQSIEVESKNYLPIAENNTWVYDFEYITPQTFTEARDTSKLLGSEVIDGITYREWRPVFFLFGFGNSVFIRKQGDETYFKNPDVEIGFNEYIVLPPFTMIDDNSSAGSILDSFETEREFAPIPVPDTLGLSGTITPKIYVTAVSQHINSFNQSTLNGQSYQDVYENNTAFTIRVDLIANMTASGIPFSITHIWIPKQDYGTLKTWYANDIGLVRSEIDLSINEVDNTIDIPIIGEIDLEEFGINVGAYLSLSELKSVAELVSYELTE